MDKKCTHISTQTRMVLGNSYLRIYDDVYRCINTEINYQVHSMMMKQHFKRELFIFYDDLPPQ